MNGQEPLPQIQGQSDKPWWAPLFRGLLVVLIPAAAVFAYFGGWILIPIGMGLYWVGRKAIEAARRATLRGVGEWIVGFVVGAVVLAGLILLVLAIGAGMNFLSGR